MKNGEICIYSSPGNYTYITGRCTDRIFEKINAAVSIRKTRPVSSNRSDIVGPFNLWLSCCAVINITGHWIGLVNAKTIRSSVRTNIAHRINGPDVEIIGYVSYQEFKHNNGCIQGVRGPGLGLSTAWCGSQGILVFGDAA